MATLSGAPRSPTFRNNATLTVAGQGVVQYSYSLNGGAFSAAISVTTPLVLSGLPNGTNRVAVIGRNAAGLYQSSQTDHRLLGG